MGIRKGFKEVIKGMPADAKRRSIDAFKAKYGYQENIPDPNDPTKTIPNPRSGAGFVADIHTQFHNEVVRAYELEVAREAVPQPPPVDDEPDTENVK